jgi:hypothetical protein
MTHKRQMNRRDFFQNVSAGAAGMAFAGVLSTLKISDSAYAKANPLIEFAKGPSDRPLDVQIAVKPIFSPLIHSDVWEGPCRASAEKPEKERAAGRERMKNTMDSLKADLNPDFRLLEPVIMEYSEDFWIRPDELAKLEPDMDEVDVYLIGYLGMPNYTATVIAETFKKPIAFVGGPGGGFVTADAVACLKAKGLEGYAALDVQELNQILSLLRTRKVFQQTNILIITDRGLPPIPVRSDIDVSVIKDKFGIGSHFVSYREFANEMDEVIEKKDWRGKAEHRAEQLIKNAEETHIEKQYVKRSFEFYYAVKKLMQKYDCNAFTVECFELCASRLAEKYKITPCLVHTLFKDEGIASACEADLNALLSMRLLMSVANKSSFMGNPHSILKDQISMNHSVPGIKMAGYDKPDLPYELRHFVKSGWGTKVMIDFTKLDEKTVTLARIDPLGKKIYLAKGEIVGCTGFRKGDMLAALKRANINIDPRREKFLKDNQSLIGCSLTAHIKVPDARESMRKLNEFGSHLSMVYGDYTREINELADMLCLEVVYAT